MASQQAPALAAPREQRKPRYSPTTSARTRTKVFRMLTAPLRVLPDFIVIGAQRSGTTSLFQYLVQHPRIVTPLYKEVRYFTDRYRLGPLYYRACFPTRMHMRRMSERLGAPAMTFEATPNYMFNPAAMQRIRQRLPAIKLVAILRDPIQRALSHHRFVTRLGWETLTFEEAIDAEPERMRRLPGESDAQYFDRPQIRRLSYVMRGRYAEQLQRVVQFFGRENLHVMCLETLTRDPQSHFGGLLRFLGLEPCDRIEFARHHAAKDERPAIAPATLRRLEEHFAASNAELRKMFGDMFPWAND